MLSTHAMVAAIAYAGRHERSLTRRNRDRTAGRAAGRAGAGAPAAVAPAGIGVLVVNLGTPGRRRCAGVRRYLKEFLSDPRVIENQGPVWQLVLNGIILPIRPRIKAKDYRKIWNNERNESPLKTITRAQAEKLAAALAPLGAHDRRRLGDALRQPVDRIAARRARRARLRAPAGAAALSAIFRCDHRERRRRGVPRADAHAQAAGGADRGTLLRRSDLYRSAGVVDQGRARQASPSSRRSSSRPITACRRTTSARAIPTSGIASRPRGCCARRSATTSRRCR